MKILFYGIKDFEVPFLRKANTFGHILQFHQALLSGDATWLSEGFDCVSISTSDDASADVLEILHQNGVKYITVRAAGSDNIDIAKAASLGMQVANVPAYSPYSVAEHTVAMMLAMNRKLIQADRQVHQHDFRVDHLIGFDIHGKTVGIIGTGRIGGVVVRILHGFGCRLLAYDIEQSQDLQHQYGVEYTSIERLCNESDIISLHVSLNKKTRHLIDDYLFTEMKRGVMLINTARGAVVNTPELIRFLDNGTVRYYGMDVYEKEKGLFFYDHSGVPINDPVLERLLSMPNVLISPHQAFATHEALTNIAHTTFYNISCWLAGKKTENECRVLLPSQ